LDIRTFVIARATGTLVLNSTFQHFLLTM